MQVGRNSQRNIWLKIVLSFTKNKNVISDNFICVSISKKGKENVWMNMMKN